MAAIDGLVVCACCVANGCECQGTRLAEDAPGCDLPELEAAAAAAARAAGFRSPAEVVYEMVLRGELRREDGA